MFDPPIKCTRLKTMEELISFSYKSTSSGAPLSYFWLSDHVAFLFTDSYGSVFIAPWRPEITSLLCKNQYQVNESLKIPYELYSEPYRYTLLKDIAEQEIWAFTYEKAYEASQEKTIQPVSLEQVNFTITAIESSRNDDNKRLSFQPMVEPLLDGDSADNVATYIIIDNKTLLLCDEYGRTFLLRTKRVINPIVNKLMKANYTRNPNPEKFVIPFDQLPDTSL